MTEIPWARKVYEAVIAKVDQWPEPHRYMSKETMEGLIRHYERGHNPEDRILPTSEDAEVNAEEADDGAAKSA